MRFFKLLTSSLTFSLILFWLYIFFTKKKHIIILDAANFNDFLPYIIKLIIIYFLLSVIISITIGIKIFLALKSKRNNKTTKVAFFDKYKQTRLFIFCNNVFSYVFNLLVKCIISFKRSLKKLNIFKKTYENIFNYFGPANTRYLVLFAKNCLDYTRKKNTIIIQLFVVIPRVIILVIFIMEIYLGVLHYYFYALLLLIIPLIFRLVLTMLKDLGPRVLKELNEYVVLENHTETVVLETPTGVKNLNCITYKPAPGHPDLDFDGFMYDFYYPMLYIQGHIDCIIEPQVRAITQYILFIYYWIHLLGFGYITNLLLFT